MTQPSDLLRHVAGGGGKHGSPFDDLEVLPPVQMDLAERDRWILPFYMMVPWKLPRVERSLRGLMPEATSALITSMLAEPNWRPRCVGAFLVALQQRSEFEDLIGRLLLRSDVCFSGSRYCLALASLNTPKSVDVLQQYLRYYLTRKDLEYDQHHALAALMYLDGVNGTQLAREHEESWSAFVADKRHWDLASTKASFAAAMGAIAAFRASLQPTSWP